MSKWLDGIVERAIVNGWERLTEEAVRTVRRESPGDQIQWVGPRLVFYGNDVPTVDLDPTLLQQVRSDQAAVYPQTEYPPTK